MYHVEFNLYTAMNVCFYYGQKRKMSVTTSKAVWFNNYYEIIRLNGDEGDLVRNYGNKPESRFQNEGEWSKEKGRGRVNESGRGRESFITAAKRTKVP